MRLGRGRRPAQAVGDEEAVMIGEGFAAPRLVEHRLHPDRLDGDADLLRMHIGHTVEIGGPITPASSTGAGANASARTLKVQSLIYISTTCVKLQ